MNKFEEILNIIEYDDLDEDVKLERIKELCKKEIKYKSISKNKIVYYAILDCYNQKVIIEKFPKNKIGADVIQSLLKHSSFSFMELKKFPDINYKGTNLFQLLENVQHDVRANNFNINNEHVDKEFYLKLLKIDL